MELGSSLAPVEEGAFWSAETRHPTTLVALRVPRPLLHRRIEERTRAMFARGVVAEVMGAISACAPSETAARALGLDIVAAVGEGRLDVEAAIELLTARTRQYAKRQETWLRRLPGRIDVAVDESAEPEALADAVLARLR